MTTRFSLFSHIERLQDGGLELGNPFDQDQVRVCRYELHRQSAAVLQPDDAYSGMAAFHRLLPMTESDASAHVSIYGKRPWPHRFSDSLAGLFWLDYQPALAFALAFPAAAAACPSDRSANCDGPPFEQSAFHAQAQRAAWTVAEASDPSAIHFGAWSNPYRLDGLKTIGLALMAENHDSVPAILVDDPTGELCFALAMASQHARQFQSGQVPYRLILIQQQPNNALCQAFESAGFISETDPATMAKTPPQPIPQLLAAELTTHLGTAISLPDNLPGDPEIRYEEALHRLIRTGFLDEEDTVFCLRPDKNG